MLFFFSSNRQACAVESAANLNAYWDVFVLFASPVGYASGGSGGSGSGGGGDQQQPSDAINAALQAYPNIHMRNVNLWTYANDTPIQQWLLSGRLFRSKYLNSHTSDLLRYVSLYKWGGTYLDLDVIVQQPLDTIAPNYAGAQEPNLIASGVLNFDHHGIGHDIAGMCLQ